MKYKFLAHTADMKFQAFGKSLEVAFANSALAMFHTMYEKKIKKTKTVKVKAKGKDFEALLYNFLEELLVLFDGEGFFLSKVKRLNIDKKKFRLEAEVVGDNAENYEMDIDVKAITYHDIFVKKEKGKWICQIVLDV